jgi:hypothetical protein
MLFVFATTLLWQHGQALDGRKMDVLTALEATTLATLVRESESAWGYPLILTLHTIGLAMLVGTSAALDLRLLGVARGLPLRPLQAVFPLMWAGLVVNAATGVLLFAADATVKGAQPVFWVKLGCIALGVGAAVRIRAVVFAHADRAGVPAAARLLAVWSLAAWTGAIVAGRLMAYL